MGYSLGVDLGTTFVAAAVSRDAAAEMVTLGDRSVVLPSVVYLADDGSLVTGEAASRRVATHPDRVAQGFKRRLGDPTPVLLGGERRQVVDLMAALLSSVLALVSAAEGGPPERVVLTHPANWGPFRRGLFEEVPAKAGLFDAATVTEPEAAGSHFAATRRLAEGEVVAVYDLGGGTFDATVLRRRADGIDMLGTPEGIERLGGIDFDESIFGFVDNATGGALRDLDQRDPQVIAAMARLRDECVLAKESLSVDTSAVIPVLLPSQHLEVAITRDEFEHLIRARIESTVGALSRTLSSARVGPGELSSVLLVGGSSRIPLVARMVSEEFGCPTIVDTHPKYAVALGAVTPAELIASAPPAGSSVVVRDAPKARPEPPPPAPEPAKPPGVSVSGDEPSAAVPSGRTATDPPGAAPSGAGSSGAGSSGAEPAEGGPSAGGPAEGGPAGLGQPAGRPRAAGPSVGWPAVGAPRSAGAAAAGWSGPYAGSGTAGPTAAGPRGPVPLPLPPRQPASRRRPAGVIAMVAVAAIVLAAGAIAYARFGLNPTAPPNVPNTPTVVAAGTISVGQQPGRVAVTPDNRRAYVTNFGSDTVSVVDTATLTVVATVSVGQKPANLVIAADGRAADVTNYGAGTLSVLDTATNAVTATVPVGQQPSGVALSPDGTRVYVANQGSHTVSVVDAASRAVVATLPSSTSPAAVAITPDGRRAYITYFGGAPSGGVAVVDTASNAVVGTVPVGVTPGSVAISPDGARGYVTNFDSDTVSVLDTALNTVTATVPVGRKPANLAISSDGRRVYVTNQDADSVSILDTATNAVVVTVAAGRQPNGVAISPDGRRIYLADYASGTVSILDTGAR